MVTLWTPARVNRGRRKHVCGGDPLMQLWPTQKAIMLCSCGVCQCPGPGTGDFDRQVGDPLDWWGESHEEATERVLCTVKKKEHNTLWTSSQHKGPHVWEIHHSSGPTFKQWTGVAKKWKRNLLAFLPFAKGATSHTSSCSISTPSRRQAFSARDILCQTHTVHYELDWPNLWLR